MQENFTIDNFLGGKIKLKQAATGYRATSDAILLASSIAPTTKSTVLDVGTGTGIIALCLAKKYKDTHIIGIDIQSESITLAKENAKLNQLTENTDFMICDITKPNKELKSQNFDFVITNPPYATESDKSPYPDKATANHESVNLKDWLDFCLKRLKPKGTLALIHRADRLDEIINILSGKIGKITIHPIYPANDKPANRVIITAVKNSRSPLTLTHGIILHNDDGTPTETAEKILRHGEVLESVI